MSDRLYLSCWIRGYTEHNMVRHFELLLRKFPFSRLNPRAIIRLYALEIAEPPLLEREYAGPRFDIGALLGTAREFHRTDSVCEVETFWDLWHYAEEWRLLPARVTLSSYGPRFPSELGEQVRVDFGADAQFLPRPNTPASVAPVRHNIRSLLHLVQDLDQTLSMEKRLLWSESGENFAERLREALGENS